jgi:hypothetical protein
MTCAEFQKVLPYIIETGGNAEEEQHLRECHVCSDLVNDLRYIAEQAKLLVPMEEPPPKVWDGIRGSLEREGLVRPARARGRLLGSQSWGAIPWVAGLALLILVAFGAFVYQRARVEQLKAETTSPTATAENGDRDGLATRSNLRTVSTDQDDEQILQQVSASQPAMTSSFRDNLKQVNASIADAKKAVQEKPDDADTRQALIRAYQQKAMLYEMATRSLQ